MTPSPRPSGKDELKLKRRGKFRWMWECPAIQEGRPSTFFTIWVWVEITKGLKFLKTSMIAAIFLFCHMRTWFLIFSWEYEIHCFPLNSLLFSLHWHLSNLLLSSIIGRIKAINWWERWFRDLVECCWYRPSYEKCALALPSAATRIFSQQAALDARQRKWKFALPAERVNIEVSCSLRSPRLRGFNFSPIFIKLIFFLFIFIWVQNNTFCSSWALQPKSERKELSAVAHWEMKSPSGVVRVVFVALGPSAPASGPRTRSQIL